MADCTVPDNIKINLPDRLKNITAYMWSLFCESTSADSLVEKEDFEFTIEASGSFPITSTFELLLDNNIEEVARIYNLPDGLDTFAKNDPVACCFYLINSLHERLLPKNKLDKFGRYPYKESIQFKNNIIELNYCQNIFNSIFKQIFQQEVPLIKSKIFWSHDIDYLFSAWKSGIIQSIRNRKFTQIPKHIINRLFFHHKWDNLDEILKLEKKFNIPSVFFFLTESGKFHLVNGHIDHADYAIGSLSMVRRIHAIHTNGSLVGLHKSAFPLSYREEINKFNLPIYGNRNHFLKFHINDHYQQIEKAGLQYDASLGFAEHYGFRNSFGRPFRPYNLTKNKPHSFIEYPLHLMDATFTEYLGNSTESMLIKMKQWITSHNTQCVISLLLHNSHMNLWRTGQKSLWETFYREVDNMGLESFLP